MFSYRFHLSGLMRHIPLLPHAFLAVHVMLEQLLSCNTIQNLSSRIIEHYRLATYLTAICDKKKKKYWLQRRYWKR
jgi:hypothetical protein